MGEVELLIGSESIADGRRQDGACHRRELASVQLAIADRLELAIHPGHRDVAHFEVDV